MYAIRVRFAILRSLRMRYIFLAWIEGAAESRIARCSSKLACRHVMSEGIPESARPARGRMLPDEAVHIGENFLRV